MFPEGTEVAMIGKDLAYGAVGKVRAFVLSLLVSVSVLLVCRVCYSNIALRFGLL